ncbi:unnamed protein product [Vitrella brassicaformis CCMP3155]|uniref:1-deoxy-D-xylulose-5-phosphate synthase n=1 Tax=Vitrella brassicaformis (strain CCMP3155) TaxID=1169540 RepID=A0A0G4GWE9_VITBC|nr:unnamed protein product [Vitrella brassicaformis CCMP3155]|mmetsp:Transcript_11165/g.27011  ORF Transcript_11165/g.27011 Transcript_11165/m.27011 type:complete len:728 (-) Transcript_11165:104-2287(-)|eukprot:CEM35238.1 unnamed protein product [Vitrella brassicaformis CCMP3155]
MEASILLFTIALLVSVAQCFVPHTTPPLSPAPSRTQQPRLQRRTAVHASASPHSASFHMPHSTPLLDRVRSPSDMTGMSLPELKQLANEVRWEVIKTVSQTGGHLSASLGVVELTVALHHVFDAPDDRIVWDVSHQAYCHKILTGRRDRMLTIRKKDGLSGFAKRSESPFDAFGAGHSSTSISAAQGMSVGRSLQFKKRNNCVAVIGDGAITGGMAYEAMNNCGYLKSRMIVILNDNGQVSLPTGTASAGGTDPAGALSGYTARLLSSQRFKNFREVAKGFSKLFPEPIQDVSARLDEYARGFVSGERATLFEELGFYYVGPVDGHDLDNLVPILRNFKTTDTTKPIVLHVKTDKGYGYPPAMKASDKMHGVGPFDIATGKQHKPKTVAPSYTSIFADTLIGLAAEDPKVVAITAAMPGGTGVAQFAKKFPQRTFDVGIAEQHAVTFAAGLACEGIKPFCAIYSTFLQRAYDQVIHDCVLQRLPVRFILDRAGLVGADGATHHGSFDLAYLGTLPDLVIMAPSDEVELMNHIQTAYEIDDKPSAVRYPRGNGYGLEYLNKHFNYGLDEMPTKGTAVPIGKGRIIKEANEDAPSKVAILSIGTRLSAAIEAAHALESENPDLGVTVADARFMRPLDIDLIRRLARTHRAMVTVEEGSVGGFGDHVLHFMALDGLLDDGRCKVRPLVLPDRFIEAGSQHEQYDDAGLNSPHIVNTVKRLVDMKTVPIMG